MSNDGADLTPLIDYALHALIGLACLMTWMTLTVGSQSTTMSGVEYDGARWLLVLTAVSTAVVYKSSDGSVSRVQLGVAGLMATLSALTIAHLGDVGREVFEGSNALVMADASIGMGAYLALVGTIAYLAFAYHRYQADDNSQDDVQESINDVR